MIAVGALVGLVLATGNGHAVNAGDLPVCSNRVINEVVKRVGCTLGDARCWNASGGFCTDYVQKRIAQDRPGNAGEMGAVPPEEVRKGDVAVFLSRAHYAYVERVVKDRDGKAVAVDLSEFNYGTCWVDRGAMVTDRYQAVNARSGVPLREVDGGFLRPVPAAR